MDADLTTAKAEALNNAKRNVASYLQHPDQLDKVEQYRRRVMRNKASVEARLKNAVQSQLDDVRSGLHQLENALQDVRSIKKNMSEVDDIFKSCLNLGEDLDDIKKCHEKQSEAAKACQHLNQIYTVPASIAQTKACLQNGNLLEAHKLLNDLEVTRDEVLAEVHKMEKNNSTSKKEAHLVYEYFREINNISKEFEKYLSVILQRILSTARSDPAQLVTVLRIIEREERSDKRAHERETRSGFLPPGRPKDLKKKCILILENFVCNRLESLDINTPKRTEDKMWLVKYLERIRQIMVDDLIVVKVVVKPCFPPSYNIFDKFVKFYHKRISEKLEDLIVSNLESDECVSILTWLREYDGPSLMMHPELQIDARCLEPLLKPRFLESLKEIYFETTSNNIKEWMNRLVQTDTKDWFDSAVPENDGDGNYNTPLPVFLFQMVDQNLQVGAQAGVEIQVIVLDTCAEQMQDFQREYRNAMRSYKSKHLEDRSEPQFFVPFVIAIANNCLRCVEFTQQLQTRMNVELPAGMFGEERGRIFKSLVDVFAQMGKECCTILLDEMFLDLEEHFKKILTRAHWYETSLAVETILATIEDYNNDFSHLISSHHQYLLEAILDRIIVEYIKAMTERRMKLKNYTERKHTADRIEKETKKIIECFKKLGVDDEKVTKKCSVLPMLSEIIKLKDTSVLSLEISGVAAKFKDFTSDHALALLSMREDVGKVDANHLILEAAIPDRSKEDKEEGYFSQITIAPNTLWDKLEMVKAKTTGK